MPTNLTNLLQLQQLSGLVCKTEDHCFGEETIPTVVSSRPSLDEKRCPIFEAVLGPGMIYECVAWKNGRETFLIGWKFRRDKGVNKTLLRIYPDRGFAADIVVMQVGVRGRLVHLRGSGDKRLGLLAVKR